jgi:2-keto-4-pentenoate hydratase/2-oxohepta-3-ene-1,7-dioic acid hydratase in catechol pathway
MQSHHGDITRIFCIGLNYVDHIKELSNAISTTAVIFMKPATCVVWPGEEIHFPKHGKDFHHEVEIVVKIGREGKPRTEEEAVSFIDALTVGLDLTLRDVQSELRKKGMPWEISKSFDQSAPLGDFVPYSASIDLGNISFGCKVNGVEKQRGNTGAMVFSIPKLLIEVGNVWKLLPGDIIYTGTPSGVGSMNIGDTIEIESSITDPFSWKIVE